VAWVELRARASSAGVYRVRVARGRGDRGFGRPQTLASWPSPGIEDSPAVTVAYGAGGDLLVAFTVTRRDGRRDRRLVAARVRRPGGAFGRAIVLGPRQACPQLTAAAAPDGRMVVAWASQDCGEGAERPLVVRAAVRPAGRRFGRAQLLDPVRRHHPAGFDEVVTAPRVLGQIEREVVPAPGRLEHLQRRRNDLPPDPVPRHDGNAMTPHGASRIPLLRLATSQGD
jgi:hypothetical protein